MPIVWSFVDTSAVNALRPANLESLPGNRVFRDTRDQKLEEVLGAVIETMLTLRLNSQDKCPISPYHRRPLQALTIELDIGGYPT